ncbi:NAD-dependent epimerase/dehydratase family protein [Ramlibacter sp. USB13]|uniref:NAD-dependent epimerase/dehydratase family protein n=1 Tax=Ramlibacter cellulosilyticus TaxID=2764187 RepID=A0A923MVR7_9BURK|nr:NAD-dependent epimerase/dehydratase family protein [Ramlibacter cellulosilyticus]MBC5784642.1 NAD-dependent epimerase/dehydratase family protein [Ramlibacter cellulosilyticus]
MKNVLVTGADGYIGRAVAHALAQRLAAGDIASLTLTDLALRDAPQAEGVRCIEGDLGDERVLHAATTPAPDTVFHFAGITSRLAEEQFALGLRVNVGHGIALFERLRTAASCPVLVFASSIGVFGTPLPAAIDDATAPAPTLSYGAEKRMIEILLADYARRGWIDARSVRLPSVVARPAQAQVALSSFASDLIREPAEGRPYASPVGPDAQIWLLSLPACVEHLLRAATVDAASLPPARAWTLPALRASVGEIVDALGRRFGADVAGLVRYAPQPAMQAQFAQWPPLRTGIAERLGMRHDGDLDTLIQRALQPDTRLSTP